MQEFEVRVRGVVGRFVATALESEHTLDVTTETVLTAHCADQSELHGLLAHVRDLGLELVSVHTGTHQR